MAVQMQDKHKQEYQQKPIWHNYEWVQAKAYQIWLIFSFDFDHKDECKHKEKFWSSCLYLGRNQGHPCSCIAGEDCTSKSHSWSLWVYPDIQTDHHIVQSSLAHTDT